MTDADFEEELAGAVGADYASEWAGNVHIGWLQESLTGETLLNAFNYNFVYEVDGDNKLVSDDEGYLVPVDGSGDATSPVSGYYKSNSFYGYSLGAG